MPPTRPRAAPSRVARLAALPLVVLTFAAGCGGGEPVLDATAQKGKQRATELACMSCHTVDGSRSEGPTWKGLHGSTVGLKDGRTVTADDAYLARSITDPRADVVQGALGPMPVVQSLQPGDVEPIVAYIRSLK